MTILQIVKLAAVLSVVLLLFSLALRAKVADLTYLVRNWRLGLGAFISMFVLVPAVALLMVRLLHLDWAVEVAIVAMALSPLPPILPGKQIKAGADKGYVTGLLFGASILSIFIAPLWVLLASRLFHADISITPLSLAKPIAISVLLPLALGLIAAPLLGASVDRVCDITSKIGTALLIVVVLVFIATLGPSMWKLVGDGTLLAFVAMAIVGLAGGHWFGGPDAGDRAALSLASSTRHPGVAIAVASHALADIPLVPAAVVLSLVVSMVLSMPFLALKKSREQEGKS